MQPCSEPCHAGCSRMSCDEVQGSVCVCVHLDANALCPKLLLSQPAQDSSAGLQLHVERQMLRAAAAVSSVALRSCQPRCDELAASCTAANTHLCQRPWLPQLEQPLDEQLLGVNRLWLVPPALLTYI